jgi:hypothetical protein
MPETISSQTSTYSSYLAPPRTASEDVKLAWLRDSLTEGETYLKNQTAFADFDKALATILGLAEEKVPLSLSKIRLNLSKRLVKELVATMANIRPYAGFKSDNKENHAQENILNKSAIAWYHATFADQELKGGLQYAGTLGTGYLSPTWESDFWVRGRGDIKLKVYSPKDVIPVQIPSSHDLQKAYAVHLRDETPINLARAMHPTLQHRITPDRTNPARMNKTSGIGGAFRQFLSPVLNRFASGSSAKRAGTTIFPVVDVHQTYIMDLSINETGAPIVMGEPGTYWSYVVPTLGADIPAGRDANGQQTYRKATAEDAAIYPYRRLITWTNTCIIRDDTSFWWHGRVPAVALKFDEWVMEFLGLSPVRDVISADDANNNLRRAINDSANARLRPPTMYDDQTIARALIEKLDPRQPAQAVGVDMSISETPIRPIYPAEYFDVPSWIREVILDNEEHMKYLLGVADYTNLAKAAQIPAGDTFEKMQEVAGPLIRDMSRSMEKPIAQLMEMWKGLFFEFYTAPRRIQMLGQDGVAPEDFEFKPGDLIPSNIPGDTMLDKAKRHMNSFVYQIVPGSLHRITQMDQKLMYVQLAAKGVPIDPWTMAEVFNIPNYGPPPAGTNTVMERWVAWQNMQGEITAKVQAKVQEILAAEQMKMGMLGGGGGPQEVPPQAPKQPEGRPNSNTKPPHIESKEGGARSTISTS